jgi:hypothetical protein
MQRRKGRKASLEFGSLLPLWSRELTRGLTRPHTAPPCTASKLPHSKVGREQAYL